jgi:DNA polymerase-3 subunit delta
MQNYFIFEAKELKGNSLINWLIEYSSKNKRTLTAENAQILVDIVGENRSLLEAQLEKIFTFLADENEITLEAIKSLSTALKEFNIFDLQNALAEKNKTKSLKISYNLLEKGSEPIQIVFMLTRYFTQLARLNELRAKSNSEFEVARKIGTHQFYLKDYIKARLRYSDDDLFNAIKALLKADLSIKTTTIEPKTLITVLIGEILS